MKPKYTTKVVLFDWGINCSVAAKDAAETLVKKQSLFDKALLGIIHQKTEANPIAKIWGILDPIQRCELIDLSVWYAPDAKAHDDLAACLIVRKSGDMALYSLRKFGDDVLFNTVMTYCNCPNCQKEKRVGWSYPNSKQTKGSLDFQVEMIDDAVTA